ncbi:MAG TPA: phage tail protein [Kofleriaceae bacterium]|nr:phage tail protein [Kofleriaceae bacterium]
MDSIPKPLKCMIKNLDTGVELKAYFNPKELSIDKKVPWNKHKSTKANNPVLEFTDADPKDLSIELLFDGYEGQVNVYDEYIAPLEEFTKIIEAKKRPPMVIFLWGKFPSFMGVIESLSTKYTMFLTNGTPVRATVTVKMKQADKLTVGTKEGEKKPKNQPTDDFSGQGKIATDADRLRADKFDTDHRAVLDASGTQTNQLPPGTQVPVKG